MCFQLTDRVEGAKPQEAFNDMQKAFSTILLSVSMTTQPRFMTVAGEIPHDCKSTSGKSNSH